MKNLKSILLATGEFKDNEYLDLYIALMKSNSEPSGYKENHHVIPVAFYKQKYKLSTSKNRHEAERYANADPQNKTVLLAFSDHCKAHWLLTKCTTEKLAESSAVAFHRQIAGLKRSDGKFILNKKTSVVDLGLTETEYDLLQQYINDIKNRSTRFWSHEQDEWLRQNRPTHTLRQCAEHLNKTFSAVSCRCNYLGIKRVWQTDEENQELLEYSKNHTAQECADYFGVSKHLIVKRWRELGFRKADYFNWTPEKDQWLRDNDSKYSVTELAELLGTSKTTVMGRRWTLGITRWDRDKNAKHDRFDVI